MGANIVIPGFSTTDRVPGFFGQTLTGQGPSSAQSVPLVLLCVGISSTSGSFVQNATPVLITQPLDADNYFGAGFQAARMSYAALKVPGALVYAMGIPAANGAVAATAYIDIANPTWSTAGTIGYRINGEYRSISIAATDTPTIVATNIANDINNQFRWPVTAAAALLTGTTTQRVTITHKSAGLGGNQQLLALDVSQVPAGMVASAFSSNVGGQLTWKTGTVYPVGALVIPNTANGFYFKVTAIAGSGTSGASEPTWPTTPGTTVVDNAGANQITWTCWAIDENNLIAGFGGGTGSENATAAIATVGNTQYDRIALGHNDATNAALWKASVDANAGPISNILEQVVIAMNGSASGAQSLAGTTLNDTRFQVLRYQNCETHPCEIAATFGAIRETTEGGNWAAFYDGQVLPGVAPQSQVADIPNHATLVSDLNNGVTPLTTVNGQAQIVRAIVTHCLNGTSPDYSTYDTSDMTVPDQIRQDLRIYWVSYFKPNNPALQDNPPAAPGTGQLGAFPSSGVAMPMTWNAQVYRKLKEYERGVGFPYPQIQNVDQNMPVSGFDPFRKCIMSAVPNVPIFGNHQIGVSVRGLQR